MKVGSKLRRTKQEIEDDKAAALAKQEAIQEKLNLIARLQQENAQLKALPQEDSEAERVLSQMLQSGYV